MQCLAQFTHALYGPVYMCSMWHNLYTQYVVPPQSAALVCQLHDVVAVMIPCPRFLCGQIWSDCCAQCLIELGGCHPVHEIETF